MYLKNIKLKKVLPLALLSMVYLALMLYSKIPIYLDPILPDGWEIQTSLGYFYTFLLIVLMSKVYEEYYLSRIMNYVSHLGTISWEVFLVQMVLIGSGVLDYVCTKLFQSASFQVGIKMLIALFITILFAVLYRRFLNAVVYVKH